MHISWQVSFNASLGTFNVAATVDEVLVEGDGKSHMTLTSSLLLALNRQLQFVTYTNTVFHPRTADTGDASTNMSVAVNVFAHWARVTAPVQVTTCKLKKCAFFVQPYRLHMSPIGLHKERFLYIHKHL